MEIPHWLPERLRIVLAGARESLEALRRSVARRARQGASLGAQAEPAEQTPGAAGAPSTQRGAGEPASLAEQDRCAAQGGEELRARFRDLRVAQVMRQGADAVTVVFDNAVADPVRFDPGQYLTLLVRSEDGHQRRRAYSICSDPADLDRVAVTVKRVRGGAVSGWINDHLRSGQVIRTLGPGGTFGLQVRSNARRRVVLIAAGVGITPLFSILQAVTAAEPHSRVELLYCNRSWDDVIFADELARLSRERPRLRVRHILTRPPCNWAGLRGRLEGDTLRRVVVPDPRAHYFVCGPQEMMDTVTEHLVGGGARAARVHIERFLPQGSGARAAATGAVHRVRFAKSGAVLLVPDGETILERGMAAGLALPSGCRMGGCGACRQRVLSGEVGLEEPNCLTAGERAQGFRLLCVGRPTGPVEIDA